MRYLWKGEVVTVLADSRVGSTVMVKRESGELVRVEVSELQR